MTADPGRRGSAWGRRRRGGLRQVIPVRLRRVGPAERIQILTVGGRVLRVATRDGDPGRPPLLLCNGIGGCLEHATAAYDAALRYAQERRQFGEPLASFQIIQQRLVSMLADPQAPAQLTDAQQRAIPWKLHDNTILSLDRSLTIHLRRA
jgi:alkylation response protein AidB-like acyl-CoA dehydrogenase